MQDRIFYSICFGFVFGVLLRSFLFVNFYLAILVGVLAFLIILFFKFITKENWGIVAGVCVLSFSLGILRFHLADKPASHIFESRVGQRVSLEKLLMHQMSEKITRS